MLMASEENVTHREGCGGSRGRGFGGHWEEVDGEGQENARHEDDEEGG